MKTTVSIKIVLLIDKRFNELRSEVDAKSKAVNKKSNRIKGRPKSSDSDEYSDEEITSPNLMKKDSDKRKKEPIGEEQKPKTEPIKAKSPIKGSHVKTNISKASKRKISDESDDD